MKLPPNWGEEEKCAKVKNLTSWPLLLLTYPSISVSFDLFAFKFANAHSKLSCDNLSGLVYASIFVGLCSVLFLTSLGSNICKIFECRLGPGGYLAVLNFFLWMGVAYVANKLKAISQDPDYDNSPSNNKNTTTNLSQVGGDHA